MEVIRYCEKCGKEFIVKRASIKKRFCSYKCSNSWKWENIYERRKGLNFFCGNCGKQISIPISDHRIKEGQKIFFCSKQCSFEYIRRNPKLKGCIICGKSFKKDRQKKCCSPECVNEHKRYLAFKRFHDNNLSLSDFLLLSNKANMFSFAGRETQYLKEYRQKHRIRLNKQRREKELGDEVLHYANRIKKNIQQAYRRGNELKEQMSSILGCSILEFSKHIESQFTEGMTRENYGEWELDHIIPISSAKSKEDVVTLCHYSNYQPLWKIKNIRKGAKLTIKEV